MKIEGKILGIDLGTKKTGLAYSDENQLIAFSWKIIEGNLEAQLNILSDIIQNAIEGPFTKVVFGLPSKEGEWKDKIQTFALKFTSKLQEHRQEDPSNEHQENYHIPLVAFQDEDFSSFKAGQNLAEIKSKLPKKKRQQMNTAKDDAESARIMLQAYLDKK